MIQRLFKPVALGAGVIALLGGAFLAGGYSQSASAAARSAPQFSAAVASAPAASVEIMAAEDEAMPPFFSFAGVLGDLPDDAMGFAGFDVAEIVADMAQADDEPGIVIVRVDKDSPAAKAGIKRGNIVMKVNETDIKTSRDVVTVMSSVKIGDKVKLTVLHGDETKVIEVTVGDKNGRPYLGIAPFGGNGVRIVRGGPVTMTVQSKVRVSQVITDSPAAKAGMKAGDVIIEIDGKKLDQPLPALIAARKPGDVIKVKVERGNETPELTVTLGENPDRKGVAFLGVNFVPAGVFGPHNQPGGPRGGQNGPRFPWPNLPSIPALPGGVISGTQVIVADVTAGSPADKAGLKRGNIIEAIDGVKVTDPKSVSDAIAARKPGDVAKLSIRKPGDSSATEISVTLGERPDDKSKAYLGVSLSFSRSIRQGGPRQASDPQG
ncbi:MAG: PDZ domain-containing protein [Anaerolineae bacterium]|nr:PDZ domain-containing protein [Anaerolineae bacterium]